MTSSDGYAMQAYSFLLQLPIPTQVQIETVRQAGLAKLLADGRAHIFDLSRFPIVYRNKFPAIGVTLTYYFRRSDGEPIICNIER